MNEPESPGKQFFLKTFDFQRSSGSCRVFYIMRKTVSFGAGTTQGTRYVGSGD